MKNNPRMIKFYDALIEANLTGSLSDAIRSVITPDDQTVSKILKEVVKHIWLHYDSTDNQQFRDTIKAMKESYQSSDLFNNEQPLNEWLQ